MKRPKIPRKGGRRLTLFLSVGSQAAALLRNVIIARLLGPEEFGVAAVIILTISFLDSFSNAGPQNLLVQAKDDDGGRLLDASHAVTLGRGLSTTLLLLTLAMPLSHFIGLELGWPVIVGLAISSLISGFLHRGVRMVQRDGDFRLESISQFSGEIAALVVAVPVAAITHSHLAIVAALIGRSVLTVATSHLMSPQRYALNWDRALLSRFWQFGWPLMINGPLLFVSAQADRLFISREIGPVALGIYSAAMVLISSPSAAILKWLGTIYMPPLARMFHDTGSLKPTGITYQYTSMMLALGFLMFLGFATLGTFAMHILYGAKFATPALLISLIGLLQVVRFLRAWPSTLSLAVGASGGILLSTAIRLLALPVGYLGLVWMGGLPGLIGGFIVGEALALLAGLAIVNRNAALRITTGFVPLLIFGAMAVAVIVAAAAAGSNIILQGGLLVFAGVIGLAALPLSVSRADMRDTLTAVRRRIGRRGG